LRHILQGDEGDGDDVWVHRSERQKSSFAVRKYLFALLKSDLENMQLRVLLRRSLQSENVGKLIYMSNREYPTARPESLIISMQQ